MLVLPRLVLRSTSDCHTVESIGESRDANEKSMPHMEERQGNGETSNVCMCVSAGQGTTTGGRGKFSRVIRLDHFFVSVT